MIYLNFSTKTTTINYNKISLKFKTQSLKHVFQSLIVNVHYFSFANFAFAF